MVSELKSALDPVVAELRRRMVGRDGPVLVALDGGSGSGKSALGSLMAKELGAVVVQSDDFFAAWITDVEWDALGPEARADAAIDWERLRAEALEPLLAGRTARWHAFDFEQGIRADGTYGMRTDPTVRAPRAVVILDGAYSTWPELGDLIDLAVLVDASVAVRHARLAAREEASFLEAWHARWDAAESYYLREVRPRDSFDLVVNNGQAASDRSTRSSTPSTLTHYYRPFSRPLRSLAVLREPQLSEVLAQLEAHEPLPFRLAHAEYLSERRRVEERMRSQLLEKGGRPERSHPHYFVLGKFSLWELDGSCKVELPLRSVPEASISFTLTDSFFNYRSENLRGVPIPPRPYHDRLYRLSELDEALERFGLPTEEWRTKPGRAFEVYVEAQVWSDAPVAHLLR